MKAQRNAPCGHCAVVLFICVLCSYGAASLAEACPLSNEQNLAKFNGVWITPFTGGKHYLRVVVIGIDASWVHAHTRVSFFAT